MTIWLMKVVNGLKMCGVWMKGNWLLLALGAALAYTILLTKNKSNVVDQLLKEFQNQQAQNRQQLDELRKIQQEQIMKQQEINAKYNEVLDRIQRDYQDQLRTLDAEKERNLRHIISVNKDNPAAMARDINILFGIPLMGTPPR